MDAKLAQDWTTISGAAATSSIAQSASKYVDVSGYEDVVIWTQISAILFPSAGNGTLTLLHETSPALDEMTFASCVPGGIPLAIIPTGIIISFANGIATVVNPVLTAYAPVAVANWLRWRLVTGPTVTTDWSVTFRIWLACNPSQAVPMRAIAGGRR